MEKSRLWATLDPFYESGPMLGRIQANIQYLRALLHRDAFAAYHFFLPSQAACRSQADILAREHPDLWQQGRLVVLPRWQLPGALARNDYHVFHLSDCMLSPGYLASVRNAWARQIFPITSLTHSLSYVRYTQDFLKHLHPGITSRDAVIATSKAAAFAVQAFYAGLRRGFFLSETDFPQPRVEIVPLGVDLHHFRPPQESDKIDAKQRLGLGREVVCLALARLSHSSKMDFLPLLRAFQRLLRDALPPEGVRLVLAGWNDEDDWGQRTLSDLASNIGLPLSIFARPDEATKLALYAAADVFVSPSDNLQETFGLTLLEAQAMGLPVVASDFDGYRDLVANEETGLLVPTVGPADTFSTDLLAPLSFDNHVHLRLAQSLAVDVKSLAEALGRLGSDAELRQRMGRAARVRAEGFGWDFVVERHLALWRALWRTDPGPRPAAVAHPLGLDYARVFAAHPSGALGDDLVLTWSRYGRAVHRGQDFPIVYAGLEDLVDPDDMRALLVLARRPTPALELADRLTAARPGLTVERARYLALWCYKHDLLERA